MSANQTRHFIEQRALRDILDFRDRVKALGDEHARLKEELEKAELLAIYAVEQGSPVEHGELDAAVQVQAGRRVPKYEEEYVALAGPAAVEALMARTAPGPDVKKLVISVRRRRMAA